MVLISSLVRRGPGGSNAVTSGGYLLFSLFVVGELFMIMIAVLGICACKVWLRSCVCCLRSAVALDTTQTETTHALSSLPRHDLVIRKSVFDAHHPVPSFAHAPI